MDDLIVLVPTRSRPQNALRQAEAWEKADTLNARLVHVVDRDDPELAAYQTLREEGVIKELAVLDPTGVPGMTAPLNLAAAVYQDQAHVIGFMGDDHLPRTSGWEDRISEAALTCCPRVVYGNDLLQGQHLATAVFMPTRMVRAMGWMSPPVLQHLYVDNFWMTLGHDLGALRYLPDVVIEHMHPAAGKAAMDDGYRTVNASGVNDHDAAAYETFVRSEAYGAVLDRIRTEYSGS